MPLRNALLLLCPCVPALVSCSDRRGPQDVGGLGGDTAGAADGVLNNSGHIETLGNGQAGGFNDLLDGISLTGKGLAVELQRGEPRPADNEATQHAAALKVQRADGAERSYDGTLTCDP